MKTSLTITAFLMLSFLVKAQISSFDADLVFHIPMDKTVQEVVKNSNITSNGFSWTTDRFGNDSSAMEFDGSTDFIEIPGYGNAIPNEEVSISFWVKTDKFRTSNTCMMMPNDETNRFAISYFYSHNSSPHHFFDCGSTSNSRILKPNADINVGEWHFVTCVSSQSRDEMAMYMDGIALSMKNNIGKFVRVNKSLRIGGGKDNNFDGIIDDFRIYKIALTSRDVAVLYKEHTLGMEMIPELTFSTYPNPAHSVLNFKLPANAASSNYQVMILNNTGAVIMKAEISEISPSISLEGILSKGLYFVKVIDLKTMSSASDIILIE